ncbi:MAG: M48 family metallopeptidase [Chitinophagaceae bacterium]
MKKMLWLVAPLCLLFSCSQNAVTGRTTLPFVQEDQMQAMAKPEYDSFLRVNRTLNNSDAAMVKRVGQRISTAITNYYAKMGKPEVLAGYQWEYNLIDSKEANAWCMPGGKIVVYTGILPLTQNESALAVVMGHEVAHAVLQHGTSRMNEAVLTQLGGAALSVLLSTKSAQTQNLFLTAYGVGTQYGSALPNSRKQELEADRYGLLFCALAGYDPRVAVPFWERMAAASNGQKPPEFMSTHPADETRIAKIKEYLPEALKNYKPAK